MLDETGFKARYPGFADADSDSVTLYLELAYTGLTERRLPDTWRDFLAGLYAAHMLTLDGQAGSGQVGGGQAGLAQSKTVDTVSVTYDTQATSLENAGHWNLTNYGTRFRQLLWEFGAGPVQVI